MLENYNYNMTMGLLFPGMSPINNPLENYINNLYGLKSYSLRDYYDKFYGEKQLFLMPNSAEVSSDTSVELPTPNSNESSNMNTFLEKLIALFKDDYEKMMLPYIKDDKETIKTILPYSNEFTDMIPYKLDNTYLLDLILKASIKTKYPYINGSGESIKPSLPTIKPEIPKPEGILSNEYMSNLTKKLLEQDMVRRETKEKEDILNALKYKEKQDNKISFLSGAVDLASGLFDHSKDSSLTKGLDLGYNLISNNIKNKKLGLGLKTVGLGSDIIGASGGNIKDPATKKDQFFNSKFMTFGTLGLNGFAKKKAPTFNYDETFFNNSGGSFLGLQSDALKAKDLSGLEYGLVSRKELNSTKNFINDTKLKMEKARNISNKSQDYDQISRHPDANLTNYITRIKGLHNITNSLYVKKGNKLPILDEEVDLDIILEDFEPVLDITLPVYEKGGELNLNKETQKNVIPEGNLHARLHHMDNDSNITKKGIPVVDNKGALLAEIELNEIIFTLEVTQKLEDLYDKYYNSESTQKEKDEAAIEAGKLLVDEILFNTDDRTGLINTLKIGGPIKISFEQWYNQIPAKYRANGYDYKLAYQTIPYETLIAHMHNPSETHLPSVSGILDEEGKIPFLKLGTVENNSEIQPEFDWYNSEKGKEFKNKYDIKYINDRYYYIPKINK